VEDGTRTLDAKRADAVDGRHRIAVAPHAIIRVPSNAIVMRICPAALFFALVLAAPASADVVDTKDERALYLKGGTCKVVIPRDDWLITREQTRADGKSVYYSLSSAKRDMTLWFFIDQTPVCQSATACLELALKNKVYDGAKDMKFAEEGSFKVAHFLLPGSQGAASQQHLIATAYVDGCWIDVHLNQSGRETGSADLLTFLKLVKIK
jgi:hypothetical protein